MKSLAIILGLVLAMSGNVFAASGSGNISNVLTLGGVNTTDGLNIAEPNTQGYFSLYSNGSAITANNFSPFLKNGAVYQVPAGKSFHIVKYCSAGTAGNGWQFASSTATIGVNSASLTSPIYQTAVSTNMAQINGVTTGVYTCFDFTYDVPASAFLGFQGAGATSYYIMVLGKETTP